MPQYIVTDFDRDHYIAAIKDVRAAGDPARSTLVAAKDAIDALRDHGRPFHLTTSLDASALPYLRLTQTAYKRFRGSL